MSSVADPVIAARDASYVHRDYRSFEFATFSVDAGAVHALLATDRAAARDLLLAIAGLVRPTAGSLAVCGVELARPRGTGRLRRGARAAAEPARGALPKAAVGLGVFEGVAPAVAYMTVEEAVAHEAALRGAADQDVLPYLAGLGLATAAEQRVSRLDAEGHARLSAALALAGGPRAAVIDLTDASVAGLSTEAACALMGDLRACAQRMGCAVVVATGEPACAAAADAATPLDIAAAELLGQMADAPADRARSSQPDAI